MRIPISLFTIALSCVLSQAASINWTNHVANIQAETNGYFGTSVNVGAGFADARIYPDSGPAVTPFRLQSTALRLAGNIFEVSNGPGFLILSLDYTGLLSAPDLLLTGDASVQGAVLTDHVVATNGVVTGGLTNTSVSQLQGAVTANQITSTNSATFQAGFTSDSGTITNGLTANTVVATNGVTTGGLTNTGVTVHTPSAIQTLAAGTVITWDSSTERVAGSGGAVTLTGTPTIQTNGVPDGALITIRGTSDANTVTLQDYRLLAGTCIAMEMSTVTLANGGAIRFQWSSANQRWQQIDFSANSSQNHKFANLTVQTNATVGGTGGGNVTITNGATATVPLVVNQASGSSAAIAQFAGGGTNGTAIDKNGCVSVPNGIVTAPAIYFAAYPTTGFYNVGASAVDIAINGVDKHRFTTDSIYLFDNSSFLQFGASSDLKVGRDSAATLQMGLDAASPIAQTIKAHDGSGSDKVGANLTIEGGQSTGTQTAGGVAISTGLTGEASASTVNAYSTRAWYHPKFVALTHATATEIQKFSLAANKILGGEMVVTIYATNSTPHFQVITSRLLFQACAVGTTITCTVDAANGSQAADSGTLTITGYTAVDNTDNTFSIKANVSSDLASVTERAKVVVTALNGNAATTITDP